MSTDARRRHSQVSHRSSEEGVEALGGGHSLPRPLIEPVPVGVPLSLEQLTVLLIRHYGLTEGTFNLMLQYQIGTGAVGPDKSHLVPGVMVGVSQVGLIPNSKAGPNTVDASVVNPAKRRRNAPATK